VGAVLVPPWRVVSSLWACPDRSWVKAAQTVPKPALQLATAFVTSQRSLGRVLTVVQRTLAAGCRLNKRKKVPCTFHLLLAVTEDNLA